MAKTYFAAIRRIEYKSNDLNFLIRSARENGEDSRAWSMAGGEFADVP